MSNAYDLVVELTDSSIEPTRRLNDFATASGWRPSDKLIFSRDENTPVTAHLLVEHGLADTAVISFLRYPKEIARMDQSAINELLSVSYNNMSDWQICIDRDNVSFIFNRTDPYRIVSKNPINYNNTEFLLNSAFKKISSAAPRPSLLSLEEALIQTIKHWKRILTAELSAEDSDDVLISLTNLFNAIIFVRAIEDHAKRHPIGTRFNGTPSLKERWEADQTKISKVILDSLRLLNYSDLPTFLGDDVKIEIFDRIDQSTISSLINDFYKHKYIPYYYDFSIISKHALSRIYERYVSIMRIREIPQQSLSIVPDLPSEEEQAKAFGAHFTPQYIARFFARYLKDQVTPLQFRNLKIADPAVGSGIFLRTILEIQSDPNLSNVTTESIERQFSNVLGIDKDPNAANAARLSLSLLHLERTERLPSELKIYATDSLTYFNEKIKSGGSFDAIFANPPFVSWDNLEPKMRD